MMVGLMRGLFFLTLTLLVAGLVCSAQNRSNPNSEPSEEEFQEILRRASEERDKQLSRPQVLYYSPVVDSSGNRIAYVKRTLDYRLKGEGLIPFLSPAPEVKINSDQVELCSREVGSAKETVLQRWTLPRPDGTSELSYIAVDLEWSGDQLYYNINFSSYRRIVIKSGKWCRGSGFCITNKRAGEVRRGPSDAGGVKVSLDEDPERLRFPTSNKIILDCRNPRRQCT